MWLAQDIVLIPSWFLLQLNVVQTLLPVQKLVSTTANDLFCSGQAQLANGNIFVCGGTLLYDIDVNNCRGTWHGGNCAYEFDYFWPFWSS